MGGVNFQILRDRKGLLKIVLNDLSAQPDLLAESVLQVSGLVVAEERALDGYDLHDPKIEVLSPVSEALPLWKIGAAESSAFPVHGDDGSETFFDQAPLLVSDT